MKKILHIITRLDRGGSAEDVLYNCIHFQNENYISKIVYGKTINLSQKLVPEAKTLSIEFLYVPSLRRNINLFFDISAFIRLYSIISKEKPDIVHTHTSKAGILGRWAAWAYNLTHKSKSRIFHSTHGHVFYGYYNKIISFIFILVEKISAFITDKILVLTENEIIEHIQNGIGKKEQFYIVHSGIEYKTNCESNLRKKFSINPNSIIVGSAGRFDPVKGFSYLIEAVKILESKNINSNIVYLLIGDGSEINLLKQKVKDYKIQNNVIFAGWQNNIEDYLAIIDIYVQPSLNEGFGKTIVIAQMLEKPVIATKVQGIVSLINDMESGILVKPANPQALCDAIIMLAQNKELRKKLAVNARKNVFEIEQGTMFPKYSIEYMNYLLEKLYL